MPGGLSGSLQLPLQQSGVKDSVFHTDSCIHMMSTVMLVGAMMMMMMLLQLSR